MAFVMRTGRSVRQCVNARGALRRAMAGMQHRGCHAVPWAAKAWAWPRALPPAPSPPAPAGARDGFPHLEGMGPEVRGAAGCRWWRAESSADSEWWPEPPRPPESAPAAWGHGLYGGGGALGLGRGARGQQAFFLVAERLVGLPLGALVCGQAVGQGEIQAGLAALLGAEAGPGLHAIAQLFLLFLAELVPALGQRHPAALLQRIHHGPALGQGFKHAALRRCQLCPARAGGQVRGALACGCITVQGLGGCDRGRRDGAGCQSYLLHDAPAGPGQRHQQHRRQDGGG